MKHKKSQLAVPVATSSLAGDALLRTMALLSVVGLHTLSSIKGHIFVTTPYNEWFVGLDQFGRFCIPLFVALSGYGLSLKYQAKQFSWPEFLSRRVWKLVPAYLVASLLLMLILSNVEVWKTAGPAIPIWKQFIFGRADYHLYFVPMIFQLYLVFPFLLGLVKRYPWFTLTMTGIFQIALYGFYVERGDVFARGLLLVTDQQQYAWGFTWIFYFVLGMCLPVIHAKLSKNSLAVVGMIVLSLASWWWTTSDALTQITSGLDPIVALRFTRWPLLAYGTTSVIALTWLANQIKRVPPIITQVAQRSYWLYLSHTLFLRIVFTLIG